MGPFQRGSRARFILALLVLTAVSLMTLDGRDAGPVSTMRNAAMSVLSPFRSAAEWVVTPVGNVWNGITNYSDLEDENAELRREIAELEGAQLREVSAAEMLEEWFRQTEIEFATDVERVTARVVSGPASSFESTVTIDKGSDHGIREGMAVVTGAGLVGRVERVTSGESVILLLTDTRMRVSTRLVSSQEQGMVEGRGADRLPVLAVSADVDLTDGEILQTSGLERSLYPPGVPIGRVVGVDEGSADGDQGDDDADDEDDTTVTTTDGREVLPNLDPVTTERYELEPSARLDRLNFLTVLLWEPPT